MANESQYATPHLITGEDLAKMTDQQIDSLYLHIYGHKAWHLTKSGYVKALIDRVIVLQQHIKIISQDTKGQFTGQTFTIDSIIKK